MSPDPNDEYFADGVTEEVILTMSKIENLEVISRTSVMQYKKVPKPVREVSRELDAGTIIEGSVRKAGTKLRIVVQAIDPIKDRHLWSESYDKELKDIFAIQSDIARLVAEALKVRILSADMTKLEKLPTVDTEAYALCLKGRYYWNERTKEGVEKAIQYFEEAIMKDPNYARSYSGLADCYSILENHGYISSSEAAPKARAFVSKALELDDTLPEAHASRAGMLMSRDWDIEAAEREFKRALELNPSYATARHWYGNGLLGPQGRADEAIAELKEAMRLDPLSAIISANLGDQLSLKGSYAEAEEQYRRTIENFPNFEYTKSRLVLCLLKQSRIGEAIQEVEKLTEAQRLASLTDMILAYSSAGKKDEAQKLLTQLEEMASQQYISNVDFALAYAAAGNKDRALDFLEKAVMERSNMLRVNLTEPHFDALRSDPRFQKIWKNLGMPSIALED